MDNSGGGFSVFTVDSKVMLMLGDCGNDILFDVNKSMAMLENILENTTKFITFFKEKIGDEKWVSTIENNAKIN
jgi:citrate lyase synthetase